ncbi:hypothetical protein NitYY0826_C1800 [Nitratiruptor sp. YY08-26]|uniref:hypothetical protein n=1 Tax=unclassified Nitratiruptor TaxID=2624044 RepID=UPI001914DE0C|nr:MULTISPECIES: hypothetical protein [unclassified Nitratiruptor]BCD62912.1 hypothetical protein NitYY0813_C1798 [Nitratiruptor sp. YY08-13]BCD66847.1 hypothetical protein NitYY0826_C1800 [Nitratiruptor sp. YY08-26]
MTIYFYAQTDNRTGLDRLRRTVALLKEFSEFDTYLMTTEFRSATYAKRVLGAKKAVGIEDFRNIGTICERGDIIIYDSDEHNPTIHQEMIQYFGKFFRISYDPDALPIEGEFLISPHKVGERIINGVLVDRDYFGEFRKEKRVFFYGDSDYEKKIVSLSEDLKEFELDLLEGFYFFVDISEKVKNYFKNIYDAEDYPEILQSAALFISHSAQSALEAAATGAKTIYFGHDEAYEKILQRAGVVHIGDFSKIRLQEGILQNQLPKTDFLRNLSVEKVAKEIKSLIKSNC